MALFRIIRDEGNYVARFPNGNSIIIESISDNPTQLRAYLTAIRDNNVPAYFEGLRKGPDPLSDADAARIEALETNTVNGLQEATQFGFRSEVLYESEDAGVTLERAIADPLLVNEEEKSFGEVLADVIGGL